MTTTATKSKPMIFTGESVRAILGGTKTMTRRVMKPQPPFTTVYMAACDDGVTWMDSPYAQSMTDNLSLRNEFTCPHPVGSKVWVKERYSPCVCDACKAAWPSRGPHKPTYEVDHAGPSGVLFRNPMFMPRWASRLSIEITAVKVERLNAISEADARAEGCQVQGADGMWLDPIPMFHDRWQLINGKKHPWSSNCRVWAYTFRMIGGKVA